MAKSAKPFAVKNNRQTIIMLVLIVVLQLYSIWQVKKILNSPFVLPPGDALCNYAE